MLARVAPSPDNAARPVLAGVAADDALGRREKAEGPDLRVRKGVAVHLLGSMPSCRRGVCRFDRQPAAGERAARG